MTADPNPPETNPTNPDPQSISSSKFRLALTYNQFLDCFLDFVAFQLIDTKKR